MKSLFLSLFILSFALLAYKPLPPGGGAAVKPNVLFVIDTSGSMQEPYIDGGSYTPTNEDQCMGQTYLDDSSNDSRMCKTKRALMNLLNNESMIKGMNMGLTRFPNKNPYSKMLVVPIRSFAVSSSAGTHIEGMKTQVLDLPADGGTPLKTAINYAVDYFRGDNDRCRSEANVYDDYCDTPIIDKCQKNYIILFTDGAANTGEDPTDAATNAYNGGLSSVNVNGSPLFDTSLPVYAIGFAGVNVDYIAEAGGTENGYSADSAVELQAAFEDIIKDIEAKNITAAAPTLVPGFAGPENDVIYLNSFKPRESKQWTGHLYKYHLANTVGDVMGALDWDFSDELKAKADTRRILTVCKDINNQTIIDEVGTTEMANFTLDRAKDLAFCMLQNNSGGAGKPMWSKVFTENDLDGFKKATCGNIVSGNATLWEKYYNSDGVEDGCQPRREPTNPTCVGTDYLIEMIVDDYYTRNNVCGFIGSGTVDFEYFAGEPCPANNDDANLTQEQKYDIAKMIQRFECQKTGLCGCFETWNGILTDDSISDGASKACIENSDCGGDNDTPNLENERSCYNGYCVGPAIDYTDNDTWRQPGDPGYANDLNANAKIEKTKDGIIEVIFENLLFDDTNNKLNAAGDMSLTDYLVLVETRKGSQNVSHIITTIERKTKMYTCADGTNISGTGTLIVPSVCSVAIPNIAQVGEVSITFPKQPAEEDTYTHKIDLHFVSDSSGNDTAFNIKGYNFRPEPDLDDAWAFSGGENENLTKRDEIKKEDIKVIARLIDFFRGKDSFQEDTTTVCNYDENGRKGSCPDKQNPLADIYNSQAKFVGTPAQMYTYSGYKKFQSASANVKSVGDSLLLVGGNDGMLHAINPSSGEEKWAFVPPSLLSRLQDVIVDNNYDKTASQFFVDASVKVMDVCDNCNDTDENWTRVLVMGFGEGQEGLMALDVTDLENPKFLWAIMNETPLIYRSPLYNQLPDCSGFKRILVWSKDGTITAYSNIPEESLVSDRSNNQKFPDLSLADYPEYDYSDLGKTWSEPVIAQIAGTNDKTGKFVAVVGAGGYYPHKSLNPSYSEDGDNTNCVDENKVFGSAVYMIDVLGGGKLITKFNLPASTNDIPQRVPARVSILAKPNMIDSDTNAFIGGIENRIMSQIYTVDMSGRIWRMTVDDDLTNIPLSVDCENTSAYANGCLKLYDNESDSTNKASIFKAITLTYDGKTSNSGDSDDSTSVWVYGGTGDTSLEGIKDYTGQNYLFAIKDDNWEVGDNSVGSGSGISRSSSSLKILSESSIGDEGDDQSDCKKLNDKRGWIYPLPPKHKLVGKPTILNGYVYFTVYDHGEDDTNDCSGHLGTSWLYSFKLFSGCHNTWYDKDPDGVSTGVKSYKASLGTGLAGSLVARGETAWVPSTGSGDGTDPVNGWGKREQQLIKISMPNSSGNADTEKSSTVPFTYFREKF